MTSQDSTAQILGILASDISDLISRHNGDYGNLFGDEIGPDEIEAALPAFLAALGITTTKPAPADVTPADQHTVHTCNSRKPGQPLPFGRRGTDCARCAELDAGATPRQAPPQYRRAAEEQRRQSELSAAIDAHYGPDGPYRRGDCGPVCTHYEY